MTLQTVSANGRALEDMGLKAINLEEWLSTPAVTYTTPPPQVIGRMGVTATVASMVYGPKVLVLGVAADAGSPSASRAILRAAALAFQGEVELEVLDSPGRVIYGRYEKATGTVFGTQANILLSSGLESAGQFTCYNPLWYSRKWTSIGAAAGVRIPIPVGTAPSHLRLQIVGPYTNPALTLRDRSGNALAVMRFTTTAGSATTYLDIDFRSRTQSITQSVSGVRTNGLSLLNVLDTFFTADPLDTPTIETSSGGLTGLVKTADLL